MMQTEIISAVQLLQKKCHCSAEVSSVLIRFHCKYHQLLYQFISSKAVLQKNSDVSIHPIVSARSDQ